MFSQPASEGVAQGSPDSIPLVTPAITTLVSLAATLALKDGNADSVRGMLGVDPTIAAQFDTALAVQTARTDSPEHEGERQVRLRAESHVWDAQAKRKAAEIVDAEERAALYGAADTARESLGLLSSMDLDNLPEAETLVDGFLVKESVARLYGPPKSYKSFIMLDIAACVGAGINWAGNKTVQSKVLYVVAEGVRGIKRRVRAWEALNKRTMIGVSFYDRAIQLGDDKEMGALIATAKRGNYEFIILDTQARCTVGMEENSATDMGRVIAALDVLKEVTGACVALVHHSGAAGGRARGSTAILGALDAEFEVVADKHNMSVKVKTMAQKDIAEAREVELDLVTPGPGLALAVKARPQWYRQTAADLPPLTDRDKQALRLIATYGDVGITITGLARNLDTDPDTVRAGVAGLLQKGCVTLKGATIYLARVGALYIKTADQELPEDRTTS
ncbi:AAA family ATPase [Streptomyces sp. NPDC058471]|uniref:AAA family ATPase n=1 Tax=Streptomyces sp. NPDC058471 TaxID=3346516 RepID=UPI0036666BFE